MAKPNTPQHQLERAEIVKCLRLHPLLTSLQVAKRTGLDVKIVRSRMATLRLSKTIESLTFEGNIVYQVLIDEAPEEVAKPAYPLVQSPKILNSTSREPYVGKELDAFDGRPGAMDAYSLPSVLNGVRTYPKR